jgi:hypothetical protein
MRIALMLIAGLTALAPPTVSRAVTRYAQENPFYRRSAFSGYVGYGLPVAEFAAARPGDGNHESGAFDWSLELEHFFAPSVSIGVNMANTTYKDKSLPELETHLSSFAGLLRYVIVTREALHPYLRLAMGGQQVQFQNPLERYESDSAFMMQAGGGVIAMLFDYVSLNAQATFTQGFTEDAWVPDYLDDQGNPTIVGFDTKYWTFSGGLSVYFP